MNNCLQAAVAECRKSPTDFSVRYFFGNTLCSGAVKNISEQCICLHSKVCFALNMKVDLFLPLEEGILKMPVRIENAYEKRGFYALTGKPYVKLPRKYLKFVNSLTHLPTHTLL